jgi:RHS repeat-associated protein
VTAYASGAAQTSYGFTAEYTSAAAGLIYLRARQYDPSMGRFTSRDTWGGDNIRPITHNLWLYAYANPIFYTDPSGHGSLDPVVFELAYNIGFTGNWPWQAQMAVYDAVQSVGKKLSTLSIPALVGLSPDAAFRLVYYKGVTFIWDKKCLGCRPSNCGNDFGTRDPNCKPTGGATEGSSQIRFATLWMNQSDTDWGSWGNASERARNNVVHELGHVLNNLLWTIPAQLLEATQYQTWGAYQCYYEEGFPHRVEGSDESYGFASPGWDRTWQMDNAANSNEEFADMFLGWVFNRWEVAQSGGFTDAGAARAGWMDKWMPSLIHVLLERRNAGVE